MIFVIRTGIHDADGRRFSWTLHPTSRRQLLEAVCQSPRNFASEEDARSSVARAKRAFRGTRFARVVLESGAPEAALADSAGSTT